jgi:hypothetical protein
MAGQLGQLRGRPFACSHLLKSAANRLLQGIALRAPPQGAHVEYVSTLDRTADYVKAT